MSYQTDLRDDTGVHPHFSLGLIHFAWTVD
jgi:hypothetical protein